MKRVKIRISSVEITHTISKLFRVIGVKKNIYKPVVDGLVETSLRGVDSHGIRLAPHYIRATLVGRINPKPKIKFKKTSPTTIIVDADHTYGITSGVIAMNKAIQMASRSGVGISVVKNSSHFGAAGIFGLMAAKKNMIGRAMTPVEDLVFPYGGKEAFLGTNAYCYAAPMQGEDPFILDMATTTISFNKLRMHQRDGRPLENGWAVDKNGEYTTDPNKAVALTHFGSYKGYGVALEPEIFASLLAGMPFGPYITHMFPLTEKKRNLSHFFEAIDIKRFVPVAIFKKRLKQMVDELRAIPPAEGFDRVRVPGDPEKELYAIRIKKGIPLTREVVEDFRNVAKEIGVKINL